MISDDAKSELSEMCVEFGSRCKSSLRKRLDAWQVDLMNPNIISVVGGLLARQTTLCSHFYLTPTNWNNHIAPIFFRCMVDVHINFEWILSDAAKRCEQFIEYGLGQALLQNEHRKKFRDALKEDPNEDPIYRATEQWIWSQKAIHFVDVNVGSWSEKSTREMATEAQCKGIYDFAYVPFSACAHSSWQHVSQFNTKVTRNPMHQFCAIADIPELGIDPLQLPIAGRYLQKTFDSFDVWSGVSEIEDDAVLVFMRTFRSWLSKNCPSADTEDPATS